MQGWQTTYLGMRELPRDISGFELQAFFTFSPAERALIDARRGDAHKLGLALHIGFLRMSGRLLDALRIVPPGLWRHLGKELGVDAPELASLRALYGRGRTLFDHQQVACEALRFRWMSEHQRRALVRLLGDEVSRCADRDQLLVVARHWLYGQEVHKSLGQLPDLLVRRYARRMASRPPSAGAKIKEPARTVEVACFLRYCLLSATDQLILMVQRRVADLWRQSAASLGDTVNWAELYQSLLGELASLCAKGAVPDADLRARLEALVAASQQRRPPSRASLVREHLIEAVRPVRSLLLAIAKLPWQATGDHPTVQALATLRDLYTRGARTLPESTAAPGLGPVWSATIAGGDRERAFRALEVATLFALRPSVRNGSVWIEHSLTFRGRERLFIPAERWQIEAKRHYARLSLPVTPAQFLTPLLTRVRAGADAVVQAARSGVLRVDDELHLAALPADDEDPEVTKLRAKIDHRIGEVQLPEVILAVDAQVRFSWIMLGREPRSADELLMTYAGILAHGASLTAAECARMMPQLSAVSIRQTMRWAGDE